jgi:hypothetical protein
MQQIIIQHPNEVILEYVKNKYHPQRDFTYINHYVFAGNPIRVFAFTGAIYDSEKDDVINIETVEILEQALALATIGLSASEINQILFGDES